MSLPVCVTKDPFLQASGLLGGGQTDGKGVSLVYYFALPDNFEMEHVENPAAVGLMQRFIHDGKEQNGSLPPAPPSTGVIDNINALGPSNRRWAARRLHLASAIGYLDVPPSSVYFPGHESITVSTIMRMR